MARDPWPEDRPREDPPPSALPRADGFGCSQPSGGAEQPRSRRAARKTVDALERLGYVVRVEDPADGRRRQVRLTSRGLDCLTQSARIFERLRARRAAALGHERLRVLERDLRALAGPDAQVLDAPGWFG